MRSPNIHLDFSKQRVQIQLLNKTADENGLIKMRGGIGESLGSAFNLLNYDGKKLNGQEMSLTPQPPLPKAGEGEEIGQF